MDLRFSVGSLGCSEARYREIWWFVIEVKMSCLISGLEGFRGSERVLMLDAIIMLIRRIGLDSAFNFSEREKKFEYAEASWVFFRVKGRGFGEVVEKCRSWWVTQSRIRSSGSVAGFEDGGGWR